MITRRFSRLSTLNLLWMQDELTDLEEQYHQARARSSLANPEMAANGTPALRMQIRNKLREYGTLSQLSTSYCKKCGPGAESPQL